jgi:altronate dehydratase small subunit
MLEGATGRAAYVVNPADNVATAVFPLEPGAVALTGARGSEQVPLTQPVAQGHKFALRPIKAGEAVIKYGTPIGSATQPIAPGEHVHLHNMRSNFDEKSSSLDCETAMPDDVEYRLY